MVYVYVALAGISAGLAVFFGFKAAGTPKEGETDRAYYVKLTAILTSVSIILLGVLNLLS